MKILFICLLFAINSKFIKADNISQKIENTKPKSTDDITICTKPPFPKDKFGQPIEGMVTLSLEIDNKGKVANTVIINSSGSKEVDQTAIKAAKIYIFKKHINTTIEKTYTFEIEK